MHESNGFSLGNSVFDEDSSPDDPPKLIRTPEMERFWIETILPYKEAGKRAGETGFPE